MTADLDAVSVVEPIGFYNSHCGYCNSIQDTSVSYGAQAKQLTMEDYELLIDRGWRRSGCFIYLPTHGKTCCVPYTHRLDVHRFQPNKVGRRPFFCCSNVQC